MAGLRLKDVLLFLTASILLQLVCLFLVADGGDMFIVPVLPGWASSMIISSWLSPSGCDLNCGEQLRAFAIMFIINSTLYAPLALLRRHRRRAR